MIQFGRPEAFQLLWVLPPLALLAIYRYRFKRRMRGRLGKLTRLAPISRIPSLGREKAHSLCLLCAVLLLVAALALPRWQRERYQPVLRSLDIVFLLDTSPSMGATDVPPSRIAKARDVIRNFLLRKAEEDRAALVGFSESSMIYSYLTSDAESLLFYFDYLDLGEESLYGTNLGAAIRSGLAVVAREQAMAPERQRNQTVFVLLSDGEDHAGEIAEAVQQAKQEGIRIFSVGIGSRQGGFIPVRVLGQQQYLVDDRGNRLQSVLEEDVLQAISSATGGRHYRASSPEDLQLVLSHLLSQEREIQGYRRATVPIELYPYCLIGALLFSLGLIVL